MYLEAVFLPFLLIQFEKQASFNVEESFQSNAPISF